MVALLCAAALALGAREQGKSWFPATLGSEWEYEVVVPQAASGDVRRYTQTVKVVKRTEDPKGAYVALEYREDEKAVAVEKCRIEFAGVQKISSGPESSERIEPPMPMLRFPLAEGRKWNWKGKLKTRNGSGDVAASFSVDGPVEVETPAGKFNAIHVHLEQAMYGAVNGKPQRVKLPMDAWYARGVGIVQRKVTYPLTTVVVNLRRFKIAPDN